MTPDRWATVERLYHQALARPAGERAAFLMGACASDDEVRQEVDSLLAQSGTSEGFLGEPAIAVAAQFQSVPGSAAFAGRRIGVYELVALLGAGGMGEVYRARDTRLGREVAIKILPRAFTSDPDRLARFEREARVLATLNHPHIGAIYGLEESEGVRAIVLELVEGQTLADRIARGALPIPEALAIARQIADALDAAHEKGIVHRDLKPANIKITPDGVAKVLDFGLAKLEIAPGGTLSQSPTLTVGGTRDGIILGTAAYMSPEQARGQAVDKRTDIWAFGCVLYEMLTGRTAFPGKTVSDTIARILEREPDWNALPASMPPGLHHLLRQTLHKDPRERLRDIADSRFVLADAAVAATTPAHGPQQRRLARYAPWLIAGAALAAAGLIMAIDIRRPPVEAQRTVIDSKSLAPLTSDSGLTTEPSISADGRLVAYASNRSGEGSLDIWVQQVTGGAAIRVAADPTDDHQPNVSPDGSLVAFRSERNGGGVYVVSPLGGESRLIAPGGMAPRFSPDGRAIAFWTGGWMTPRGIASVRRTFVVPTDGGEPRQMASQLASSGDPIWAPDGRALLMFGRLAIAGPETDPDWWWVPLGGAAPVKTAVYQRLAAAGLEVDVTDTQPYPGDWTTNGVLFGARLKNTQTDRIWRIAVDPQSGRVTDDPVEVTMGTTLDGWPAASRDRRLLFAAVSMHSIELGLPLDANRGKALGIPNVLRSDTARTGRTGISGDGRLMVFPLYGFGSGGVWLKDLRTGRERQLVVTPPVPLNPVISRSGRWVAYTVTAMEEGGNSGRGAGYVIATNEGTPRKVCDDCEVHQWTADDRGLLVLDGHPARVTLINVETGQQTLVLAAADGMDRPLLAPNGQWIAFGSSGRTMVARFRPGTNTASEWVEILGHRPQSAERAAGWSPDSRLLYLLLERDGFRCLYAVSIDPVTGHAAGEPFAVFHFHNASRQWGSTGFGNAVMGGLFVLDQYELTGNIWMGMLNQ